MTLQELQNGMLMLPSIPERHSVQGLVFAALVLNEEAGEVAGKVKRVIRDDGGKLIDARRQAIMYELGHVLWGCSVIADELGVPLDDIAHATLLQLRDRERRGAIHGEGDDR